MGNISSLSNKALATGLILGLIVGLVVGYIVIPKGVDTTELEQQISDLQGQIIEKDSHISTLQSQIDYLQSQIDELTPSPSPPYCNATWNLVWEYKADNKIKKVSISSDGNYIVAITDHRLLLLTNDGQLLWEKDEEELYSQRGADSINDVSISKNCNYIVVGARVYSGNSSFLISKDGSVIWKKLTGDYNYVAISDDGEYIALGATSTYSGDGWIYLYKNNGTELWRFRALDAVKSVSISEDGEYIVAGDGKGYVYLLDRSGNLIWDKKMEDYYSFSSFPEGVYVSISLNSSIIGGGYSTRLCGCFK